jgi:pimeloyl-ACP methyl ester carboxylesterase
MAGAEVRSFRHRKVTMTILRWIGRIFLGAVILLAVLILYGLVRESMARSKYRAEYPPQGRMVSLGTHDLHLYCVGSGEPTVVFESDLDQLGSLSWWLVQSEVGEFTRACSYDRAGIMWSEPGPRLRDGEAIASELAALLDAAGEDGPYVMVGHALGGAYVRIFAGHNPDAVCGMVLVDSAHPDELARFGAMGIEREIPASQIRPLILLLSHLGMPRRFTGPQYSMPQEVYDAEQAFLPESSVAWFDESVEGPHTLAQAAQWESLGDVPLIVLSSARPVSSFIQSAGWDPQDLWLELQQELTLLSEDSEIRMLPESGHYIQFDEPEEVIEAVRDVVGRCAGTTPLP